MLVRFVVLLLLLSCGSLTAQEEKILATGRMAGELAISSTGAATYLVPLEVPPGIKEVVPSLALSYNSQAGDGIAGWGWNIAGLSTISRIGATLYHDGFIDPVDFDEHDRFALDGQRLILTQGEKYGVVQNGQAIYKTENYSNIKVIGHGSRFLNGAQTHTHFTVLYPDGSKAEYGNNYPTGNNDLEWAINFWEDPQGNRIKYNYTRDEASTFLIESIEYGGTADIPHTNKILFLYEDRSKKEHHYISGKKFHRTQRLSAIAITTANQTYRNYTLEYDESNLSFNRLISLIESTSTETKPPVTFSYPNEKYTEQNLISKEITDLDELIELENDNLLTGDYNGDGRLDYSVQFKKQSSSFQWIFSEFADDGSAEFSDPHLVQSPIDTYPNTYYSHRFITTTGQSSDQKLLPQQSLTRISERSIGETPPFYTQDTPRSSIDFVSHTLLEDGSVDQWTKTWTNVPVNTYNHCNIETNLQRIKQYYPGDFNGDGILDVLVYIEPYTALVCSERNGVCSCYAGEEVQPAELYWIDLARHKTNNFVHPLPLPQKTIEKGDQIVVFDHDGDGRADLLHFKYREIAIYSITPNNEWEVLSNQEQLISIDPKFPFYFGDYNGDGKIDFLHPREIDSNWWVLHEATGKGFKWERVFGLPVFRSNLNRSLTNQFFFTPQDINGDGYTDIVYNEVNQKEELITRLKEELVTKMSLKLRVFERVVGQNNFNISYDTEKEYYFNSTGNRKVYPIPVPQHQYFGQNQFAFLLKDELFQLPFSGQHAKEMLLEQVNHQGLSQKIYYSPLLGQGEHYTPDHSQIYPYVNINNAPNLYLVNKVEATANGQTATQKFRYKGAVSHAGGLGFLGFLATGRTNNFGVNVPGLWSISQHDPTKRGAVHQSWTSVFNHFSLPN